MQSFKSIKGMYTTLQSYIFSQKKKKVQAYCYIFKFFTIIYFLICLRNQIMFIIYVVAQHIEALTIQDLILVNIKATNNSCLSSHFSQD